MRIQEGAIETFYYYLWLQNDSIKQNKVEFHLPDTIIYRLGVIQAWYFTHNNEIVVKKIENRTLSNIQTQFLKGCENDICAYFISCTPGRDFYHTAEIRGEFLQNQLNVDCKTAILYLNKEEFLKFISNSNIHRNGILQKFTQPATPQENVIQAIWSQNLLLLSQRLNNVELNQNKFDVQERCSTFNSSESYSKAYSVKSKVISHQIQRLINYVTARISVVTYEKFKVNRATIYCKIDRQQRINLLYCTSLRTNYDCPFPMYFGQLARPENVKNTITTNKQKPKKLIMNIQCFYCSQYCQEEDLHPLKYQFLIKKGTHFRMDIKSYSTAVRRAERTKTEDNPENYVANTTKLIPDIFKKLYPQMTYSEFLEIQKNESFLNKEILLCLICYLKFTQIQRKQLEKTEDFQKQLTNNKKSRSITNLIRQVSQEVISRNIKQTEYSIQVNNFVGSLTQRESLTQIESKNTERTQLQKTTDRTTIKSSLKSSRTNSMFKNSITQRTTTRKTSM